MYIRKINDDYNDTLSINNNCSNNDKKIEILIPSFTTIPCGMSLMCLISFMVYTLFNYKQLEKFLYPNHPLRFIKTGPSECGKSEFLKNLFLFF